MKKFTLIFCALMALLSVAYAQSPVWIDDLYYTLDDSNHTAALTMPNSWSGHQVQHLVIPDNVVYNNVTYAVTSIREDVFYSWLNLTEVTIGANIEFIPNNAFLGCINIETVHFNALHCNTMQYPFSPSKNALTTLTIGAGVTTIPDRAFRDLIALTGVISFPASVTSIGVNAFSGCTGITGLVLPNPNIVIGNYAFSNCRSIVALDLDIVNVTSAFGSCTGLTELTLGPNVQTVDINAFLNCTNIGTVHFNAINCTSMTSFSASPFRSSTAFTTLTIGAGVTRIPDYAFTDCDVLTGNLVIPATVNYLGQQSFAGTAITTLNVDVTEILAHTFGRCNSLTEVTIGPEVQSVAGYAFQGSAHIETVHFNATQCASMKRSDQLSVFYDSRLTMTTLTIGDGVTQIPNYAFNKMQAVTGPLVLPSSLTTIGIRAFYGCSNLSGALDLTHVSSLESAAFCDCASITSLIVNTQLPNVVFENCTSLAELTLGPDVTVVSSNAFEGCDHVSTLHFNATRCTVMSMGQSSVLSESIATLQTLTIGEGVTVIPNYAFRNFANITSPIVFPSSLKTIGIKAFEQCTGLSQVTFPTDMMNLIDESAFNKCSGIQGSVSINCYEIGNLAFYNCSSITNLAVNGYQIGGSVFSGCSSVRVLTIGPDVYEMSDNVFSSCDHIQTINYNPVELRIYSQYPFWDCYSTLTCVNIGERVTRIGNDIFNVNISVHEISCACTTPPAVSSNIFPHPSSTTLYIPYGAMNAYRNHAFWGQFNLAYIPYDLWVGNTQVTVDNAADILGDGKVSYDIANNILVLDGANISVSDAPFAIKNYIPDLTIRVDSQSSVVASTTGSYGIISHEDLSIVANSLLTVQGVMVGIQAEGNLTIRGSNRVEATGADGGVMGNIQNPRSLIVDGVTLYAKATRSTGRSLYFGSLTRLGGVIITTPTNGLWDNALHCVTDSNGIPVSGTEVVIGVQNYDIVRVANIAVTSANADDITGPGITGHVSYDADTHTLILDHATITYNSYGAVGIRVFSALTIRLVGDNTIVTTDNSTYGICGEIQTDITIEGTGTLDVKGSTGIYCGGLILNGGCQVKAEGTASGNFSGVGVAHTLSIDNSVLRAKCADGGNYSLHAYSHFFTGCDIIEPQGVHWHNSMVTYTSNDSPVKEWVVIAPTINGDIEVAGTTINWDNAADVLGDGTVSYDMAANTLTLNNADIEWEYPGIVIDHSGVKIVLVGDNTITSSYNYAGILSWQDLTIMGEGSLTVSGGSGISVEHGDFIIQGGSRVTALAAGTSYNAGITGSSSFSMIVDDAYVRAAGSSSNRGAIDGFDLLTLTDCEFVSPAGAAWNASHQRIELNGTAVVDASIASNTYFLQVCGYAVTSANAADILGNGTASYDPMTNTLTFDNVNETGLNGFGIWNKIPKLRILLKGDNILAGSFNSIRSEQADVIIEGPGRISLYANTVIEMSGNLTIRNNAVVETYSKNDGISIDGEYPYTLTVDHATLIADGTRSNTYPIYSFKNLVMNGCSILDPQGIVWHNPYLVNANGDPVRNARVVIGRQYDLWLAGNRVNDLNAADVLGDGHVSYDVITNILTFADAQFSENSGEIVYNSIPDLHLVLEGTSNLHNTYASQYNQGFYTEKTLTIEGDGILNITGYSGITAEGDSLVLRGGCQVIVDITSMSGGIVRRCVYGDENTCLIIRNSRLEVHSINEKPAISGFYNMYRYGCQIITPAGATYDQVNRRLATSQGPVYDAVIDMARYDLYVAGRRVTADNAADVLGDGTVSYSSVLNRLTLNNAHISSDTHYGISNTLQDLRVMLVGDNTITTYASGIHNEVSGFTIMGTGTLSINAHDAGIEVPSGTLTLSGGCIVEVNSTRSYGIIGNPSGSCSINGSTLVTEGDVLPIFNFADVFMEGCDAYADEDVDIYSLEWKYNEDEDGFAFHLENGDLVYSPVVITPHYGISVFNEGLELSVTQYNASDVLDDGGSVRYDASYKKLTLDNATLQFISSNVADLIIELVGENAITQNSDGVGLDLIKTTMIQGPGSLYLRKAICINVNAGANLSISNCVVDAIGCGSSSQHAIIGHGGSFIINNAILTVEHENTDASCTIYGFGNLTLQNNVNFLEPYLGQWNSTYGYVQSGSQQYMGRVVLGPAYPLWVLDTRVTPSNAYDVMGDGTVSFDASTATLTLHDATLTSSNTRIRGINSEVVNLVIELQGSNTITTRTVGILMNQNSTIGGEGTLDVTGSSAINANRNLTIQGGCTVNAVGIDGNMMSDAFYGGTSSILTIDHAIVRASNAGTSLRGTIYGYASLNLTGGVSLVEPQGAVWDATGRCLKVGNNVVTGQVIFAPTYGLSVEDIKVSTVNANDVLDDGGSVVFDNEALTLTLTNADLSNDVAYGIDNQITGLNIVLVGGNAIAAETNGIRTSESLTIRGSGTLDVAGECAINACSGDLVLQDGTIHANSTGSSATIIGSPSNSLTVNEIDLTATMDDSSLGNDPLTVNNANNSNEYVPVYGYWCDSYQKCEYIIPADRLADMANSVVSKMTFELSVSASGSWGDANFRVFMKEVSTTTLSDFVGYADATVVYQGPLDGTQSTMEVEFTTPYIYHGGNLLIGFYNEHQGSWKNATFHGDIVLGACISGYNSSSLDEVTATQRNFLPKTTFDYVKASQSAISGFGNVNITAAALIEPKGAVWNSTTHCFEVDGIVTPTPIVIEKYKGYELWVAGTRVSNFNASDVLGDGTVSYEASTHTLHLNGMEDDEVTTHGIESRLDMLNIVLEGTNTLTAGQYGIYVNGGSLTITGMGSLNVTGTHGIYITGGDLTITGECTVDATGTASGPYSGICGGISNNMIVNGIAKVTATANETSTYGAIVNFASLTFGGECGFVSPIGVVWGDHQVKVNGVVTNGPVVIGPPVPYDLLVDNEQVTTANASDVLGDGTVSYDALTNTLTLNGVNINVIGHAILCYLANLNIVLEGVNTISALFNGFYSEGNVTIEGSGTLNITGSSGIMVSSGDLTIRNGCSVTTNGEDYGVSVYGTLTIANNAILETNSFRSLTSSKVVINPGGQLAVYSAGTNAKVEKNIPTSTWDNGSTGWTLLSSPLVDGAFSEHSSLVKANGQYDLYRYNETNHAGEEWTNFKQNGFANYEAGRGYLYAKGNDGTEYFEGVLNYDDVTITLTYTSPQGHYPLAGFNLIGNPFTHNIYKGPGAAIDNSHLEEGYYTISDNGTLEYHSDDEPIAPMQAILVRTDATISLTIKNTMDAPR